MVFFGQVFAWRELSLRGLHLASNPGSFFLYLMTGTHAIDLLAGIAVLTAIYFQISRATQRRLETVMGSIALYWHFTDALWLYLVALLFVTIQR
jgi:cytochrome c oxidase subunit 3